jgi:hypothetical protein
LAERRIPILPTLSSHAKFKKESKAGDPCGHGRQRSAISDLAVVVDAFEGNPYWFVSLRESVEVGRGWDIRRERMSRRIERSALMLFAKERAEDVTVERLAAAAGISVRTWFRYFAGRDEVFAALHCENLN